MQHQLDISSFKKYSTAKKIEFFDSDIQKVARGLTEKELYAFLRATILDKEENSYIRKKALEVFVNCILLKMLKVRHGLSLLIDDWETDAETFLEAQRLKELFLFYDEDDSVEEIFQEGLTSSEAEISSQCFLNLGLIKMQRGFSSKTKEDCLKQLDESLYYFNKSGQEIENRVDAKIYKRTVLVVIDILKGIWGEVGSNLEVIANLLFRKEVFSFKLEKHSLYSGFYRVLWNLTKIKVEDVSQWLDFRNGLNRLFVQYSEIKNQTLKDRLNESVLSKVYVSTLKNYFLEPYFALSLKSDVARIDARLQEVNVGSDEHQFLLDVRRIVEDSDKKKIELQTLEERLKKAFPLRTSAAISNVVKRIKYPNNPHDILNAYEELSLPTDSQLLDHVISACSKLQGNRTYRGNYSEDDRNTYIADLLESSGYIAKDQTRWSTSYAGKSAGEIDIFLHDKFGHPLSIIEALNLDSLKQNYTKLHLDKVFKYDVTGLQSNFIVTYSNAKNFADFWNKYKEFIKNHTYKYDLITCEEIENYPYSEIRVIKAKHLRSEKQVSLYHIAINLYQDKE